MSEKTEPGFLHGSASSTLQCPQALRAAGQDFRMDWDAAPSAASTGRVWAPCGALAPPPSTAPAHVLRDSSCPLPALQLGLHCTPAEIQTGFCLNPTAWSTGNQQLLCLGCSSAKGSRVGAKHELPEKPTPPSLWISCGFVVSQVSAGHLASPDENLHPSPRAPCPGAASPCLAVAPR